MAEEYCNECGHMKESHWGGSTPEHPIVGECMWEADFENWYVCTCDQFVPVGMVTHG